MRYNAFDRLEQLAGILKSRNIDVEIDLFETRIPESLAIVIRALQWDADRLVVGIHSLLGIKRFLMQRVFGCLNFLQPLVLLKL
jgi:nucleotide-binding universal stress UspA family protein